MTELTMATFFIAPGSSVIEALKQLDVVASKVLFVVSEEHKLLGALSDGDIRRFLLRGGNLTESIDSVYNRNSIYLQDGHYSEDDLKSLFVKKRIELIPVIDDAERVINCHAWHTVIEQADHHYAHIYRNELNEIPVVIMAGGKGTRLKPFTDVLPKPLVPINEKPIMDWIIDEFYRFGAKQFYATLNYRGKMIEAYYNSIEKEYSMNYKWEDDFFGTAGSLTLLEGNITGTFIVSNCDIIVKADYADVISFHKESGALMTVVSSIQHHQIPYGVIEFGEGGVISSIKEKPEYTHAINTGVYILEKECLNYIPRKKFFHITQLIESLIGAGQKVVTYPVNENAYIDVGQWEEYNNAVENFKF